MEEAPNIVDDERVEFDSGFGVCFVLFLDIGCLF